MTPFADSAVGKVRVIAWRFLFNLSLIKRSVPSSSRWQLVAALSGACACARGVSGVTSFTCCDRLTSSAGDPQDDKYLVSLRFLFSHGESEMRTVTQPPSYTITISYVGAIVEHVPQLSCISIVFPMGCTIALVHGIGSQFKCKAKSSVTHKLLGTKCQQW